MITKLVALIAVVTTSIGLSVATLIYGWGLEPKSWTAIILFGIFGQVVVSSLYRKIIEDDRKIIKDDK
jgi:hypothetical protein